LVSGLRKSEVDLSLIVPPIDERFLVLDPLWRDDWLVVLPEDHALAAIDRISIADLAGVGLILSDPQLVLGAHEQIRAAFQVADAAPEINVLALRRSIMLFLAAAGAGVTFIPASFAGALVPGTVARSLAIEPLTVSAAYRANNPPGMAMQFLRAAKESFGKLN
jgi:DNA-binding transcriptional LysR family regulator